MIELRIAYRYLFSKKSTNAINIISWVSMVGMAVGAFALVTVLSVFNGFEGLVLSLYNSFYPDIEVRAAKGKTFEDKAALAGDIMKFPGVKAMSRTLEETAYLEYGEAAQLATVKGVDDNYNSVADVKNYVRYGEFLLHDSNFNYTVVGANIAYPMNINVERSMESLSITVPRKGVTNVFLPEDAFTASQVVPAGIFSIQQEFDSKYVFVSLDFARNLLGSDNQVSAYEIKLDDGVDLQEAKEKLSAFLGTAYTVRTRYEQKAETYRVMQIERWVTTAILAFIILIISFNIIGSLSMLVLEKSRDISILKAMGASNVMVQKVYLFNGLLAALIGTGVGMALGYGLCLLQLKFHFLKLSGAGDSSFVIDYYPVVLKLRDTFTTLGIVISVSLVAAYFPARRAGKAELNFK